MFAGFAQDAAGPQRSAYNTMQGGRFGTWLAVRWDLTSAALFYLRCPCNGRILLFHGGVFSHALEYEGYWAVWEVFPVMISGTCMSVRIFGHCAAFRRLSYTDVKMNQWDLVEPCLLSMVEYIWSCCEYLVKLL